MNSSQSVQYMKQGGNRSDRSRYQNIHKTYISPDPYLDPSFLKPHSYSSIVNQQNQIHFSDLRAQINKPKATLQKHKFQGQSAYTSHFIGSDSKRQPQIRPQGELKVGQGRFQGNSSYGNDYVRNGEGIRAEKIVQRNNQVMPRGDFVGNSTYNNAYIESKIQSNPKIVPQSQLKVGGKFQGESSYLNDFHYKQSPKVQKSKLPHNQPFPKGNFQGQSNYNGSYIGTQVQKARQFRPQQQWKMQGKFQGSSSYQNDFHAHSSHIRSQRTPLPKNKIMPQGKFQTNTSYQDNYLPNQPHRQRQIRPQGTLKVGDGYFQGVSKYNDDFQTRQPQQRDQKFKPRENQVMPKGRFDGNSNYTDNYVESKISREQSFRPRHQLEVGGKFQGASSYSGDYQQRKGIRAEKVEVHGNQIFQDGKFNGQSQYTNSYVPTAMTRVQKVVMKPELKVGQGRFQGSSTYNNNYQDFIYKKQSQQPQLYQAPQVNHRYVAPVGGQALKWNKKNSLWQ